MSETERERLPTEALLALQSGHKVEAVRIVREQTGLGLSEARGLVDRAARESDPEMPRLAAGKEDSGVLRLVAAVVVLAVVAAAAFYLL